ncbi:MAG: hypothetical protein AB1635_05415 [Acidobacteriota bacterium]
MAGLSLLTAWASWGLLIAVLLVGPWTARARKSAPVNVVLRRRLGIAAASAGLLHAWLGTEHSMTRAYLDAVIRTSPAGDPGGARAVFGWGAALGAVAAVVVLVPLALSNDWSLRRLGPGRWKALQRLAWVYFALVTAHGVLFQVLERRPWPAAAAFAVLAGTPLLARIRRRR